MRRRVKLFRSTSAGMRFIEYVSWFWEQRWSAFFSRSTFESARPRDVGTKPRSRSLNFHGLAVRKDNRRRLSQRVLNLGHRVGMTHKVEYLFARGPSFDLCAVRYVTSCLAFATELAADLHLNLFDLDASLLSFTIKIVAVACRKSEEEQFAAVY